MNCWAALAFAVEMLSDNYIVASARLPDAKNYRWKYWLGRLPNTSTASIGSKVLIFQMADSLT